MDLLLEVSLEAHAHGVGEALDEEGHAEDEGLDALGEDGVAAVVDHDIHQAGDGEEQVDGGVPGVSESLCDLVRRIKCVD